jgi:hypothetical protein
VLRDTLLHASMVNPRPYLLQSLTTLAASGDSSAHAVGGEGSAVQQTVLGVMSTLATNGRALFGAGADEWMRFNLQLGASLTQSPEAGVYDWYNTHPMSFNALSVRQAAYRLLAAAAVAGVCKVLFKLIPSVIFGGLCKAGVTRVAKVQQHDCFGREVPQSKAYVVEIPVR